MNVLEIWKMSNTLKTTQEQLAKSLAECDELREQMEERDKETAYLISQKIRTIEALRCEIDAKKKILSDTFSVFESFYARLKAGYKHDHNDAA